jgi:hypothetical protein
MFSRFPNDFGDSLRERHPEFNVFTVAPISNAGFIQ